MLRLHLIESCCVLLTFVTLLSAKTKLMFLFYLHHELVQTIHNPVSARIVHFQLRFYLCVRQTNVRYEPFAAAAKNIIT